jgi:hypothetical protein
LSLEKVNFLAIPNGENAHTLSKGSYIMSLAESSSDNAINTTSDLTIAKVIKMPEPGDHSVFVKVKSREIYSEEIRVNMKFIDVVSQSDVISFLKTALQCIGKVLDDLRFGIMAYDQEHANLLKKSLVVTRQIFYTNAYKELERMCEIDKTDSTWEECVVSVVNIMDYCNEYDIFQAIWGNKWEVVERLLVCCKERDSRDRIPLHDAARLNAPDEVLNILLNSFPDGIKVKDCQGHTPLDYAISNKSKMKTIEVLAKRYTLCN